MWRNSSSLITLLCLLMLPIIGCTSVPNGPLNAVAPISDQPRVGNVYLVRGFIGVFSTGMDDLSKEISSQGIRSIVFQDTQTGQLSRAIIAAYADKTTREPLILIGHSYGADDVVRIARDLKKHNITVDLLVTFDPVVPGKVPDNVCLTLNYFKPQGALDALPWLRGIPLEKEASNTTSSVANINLATSRPDLMENGTNHFNIEKNHLIYSDIMVELLEICPPRSSWTAQDHSHSQQSAASSEATAQRHLHQAAMAQYLAASQPTIPPYLLVGYRMQLPILSHLGTMSSGQAFNRTQPTGAGHAIANINPHGLE